MTAPGKSLEVLHVITSLECAGAQTALARLVRAANSGCRHTVACLRGEDFYSEVLRAGGVEVVSLDMPPGRPTLRGIRGLAKLMRRTRPDVVQTWMYHADLVGGVLAYCLGFRSIVWGIRNSDLDPRRSRLSTRAVMKICAMLSSRVPKAIVSCSRRAMEIHLAQGYDGGKFELIPNGYDVSIFRPDPETRESARREWGVADDAPLVGMVARWDPQKDHANFLAAASRVRSARPAARFVLVGPGMTADNAPLRRLIEAHHLEDAMLLLGPRPDIPKIMNGLDLHVLSSAYGEAFPNVVAEAMACGVPCVVTDVGDAADIVGDTGWTVPSEDSESLANAISEALAKRAADGAASAASCRKRIEENFSLSKMAVQYQATWGRVSQ